jgi:capsular polysaccharide export protein
MHESTNGPSEIKSSGSSLGRKVVLFLQGPSCGFFSGVAEKLKAFGHRCLKVNLCAGEACFYRGEAINYRGSYKDWEVFLKVLIQQQGVTDIVLNGDQRLYHKVAVKFAREMGIRIVVTDFGYFRPDWITLQLDGTLGDSSFPKDLQSIRSIAKDLAMPDFRQVCRDSGFRFAYSEALYGLVSWGLLPLFPRYRPFGIHHPILHGLAFFRTYLKKKILSPWTSSAIRKLLSNVDKSPFFFFPMQLEGDFQIRSHSSYPSQILALEEVMASFALKAPEDSLLVIKQHPLEPDFRGWRRLITRLAREIGVASRVVFLQEGSIARILPHAVGVITINSTVGFEAVRCGKKVKLMGRAVYDVHGIVFPGTLDEFWVDEFSPQSENIDALVKALASMTQVRGSWFNREGLAMAIDGTAERIHHGTVGEIDPTSRIDREQKGMRKQVG